MNRPPHILIFMAYPKIFFSTCTYTQWSKIPPKKLQIREIALSVSKANMMYFSLNIFWRKKILMTLILAFDEVIDSATSITQIYCTIFPLIHQITVRTSKMWNSNSSNRINTFKKKLLLGFWGMFSNNNFCSMEIFSNYLGIYSKYRSILFFKMFVVDEE